MEAAYYERGDVGGTLARALCVFASLVALALALFLLPKSTSNFPFVHEFKNALSTPPGSKSVASAAGGQTGGVCTALPVLKDLSAPEIALQNIPHGYATNGSDVSTCINRHASPLTSEYPDLALQNGLTANASDGSPLSTGKTLTLKQIKKKKKNKADKLRKKSSRVAGAAVVVQPGPLVRCRVATHSLSTVGDEPAV
jgi:hypothetical protein